MDEFENEESIADQFDFDKVLAKVQKQALDFKTSVVTGLVDLFYERFPETTVDRQKMIDGAAERLTYLDDKLYTPVMLFFMHYKNSEEPYLDVDFEEEKRKDEERKAEAEAESERMIQMAYTNPTPEKIAELRKALAVQDKIDEKFKKKHELHLEQMDKWIKKCVAETFDGIEDLPGRGFRELDYMLWVFPRWVYQDLFKVEKQLMKDEEGD